MEHCDPARRAEWLRQKHHKTANHQHDSEADILS